MSKSYNNKTRLACYMGVRHAKHYKSVEREQFRSWLRREDKLAIKEQLSKEEVRPAPGKAKPDDAYWAW